MICLCRSTSCHSAFQMTASQANTAGRIRECAMYWRYRAVATMPGSIARNKPERLQDRSFPDHRDIPALSQQDGSPVASGSGARLMHGLRARCKQRRESVRLHRNRRHRIAFRNFAAMQMAGAHLDCYIHTREGFLHLAAVTRVYSIAGLVYEPKVRPSGQADGRRPRLTAALIEQIRHNLGFDRPVFEQYLIFLRNFAGRRLWAARSSSVSRSSASLPIWPFPSPQP